MSDKFNINWNVEQLQNKTKKSNQNIDKSINFNQSNIILNEIKDDIKKSNKYLAWFAWLLSWIIWWIISWLVIYLIIWK